MIRTRPARPIIRPVDRAARAGVALVDLLLVTTLPSSTFAADRDLAGHWTGTVQVPGRELELDVDLRSGTDGWREE